MQRRPELTFKQNRQHGRHGWLRLTPAYSVRLVEQILDEHGQRAQTVFDPFSGSGTTALCAAYRGKTGLATDINPFLIWLARAKASVYDPPGISAFTAAARDVVEVALSTADLPMECPPLSNIERWWQPAPLTFLLRLKAAIDAAGPDQATLLNVAFCRTLMKLSNAAFNHQSMSFKLPAVAHVTESLGTVFLSDVEHVATSAADNPGGGAEYLLANARESVGKWRGAVDLLITSPPYPNRMSYIRELRPYMYWLRFLFTGRQAGELDWEAIGGTWGSATSRLAQWCPRTGFECASLQRVLVRIRAAHLKNGPLLANYVHKYFDDMFEHLGSIISLLTCGATVHYIVGNSIFYGHEVAAEQFLAQQMADVGLCDVSIVPIRKRNSKKGLLEFHVSARRAG